MSTIDQSNPLCPVPGSHGEAFYISDFISPDEEAYLLRKILDSPLQKWKSLANRRLQLWGGSLVRKQVLIGEPMPSFVTQYPNIIDRICKTGVFDGSPHGQPNHIIMNEYLPGQGIMPHEDGPAYFPAVATLSLGSHALFHYYVYNEPEASQEGHGRSISTKPVLSLLLEPRSLVVTTGTLYRTHLHGIDATVEDTIKPQGQWALNDGLSGTIANWDSITSSSLRAGGILTRGSRYSLTCRDVERVSSLLGR